MSNVKKEITIRKIRSYNKKNLYNLLIKRQQRTLDVLAEGGDLLEEIGLHTEAYTIRKQVLRVGKHLNLDATEKKQRFLEENRNEDVWTQEDADEIKRLLKIEKEYDHNVSSYIGNYNDDKSRN